MSSSVGRDRGDLRQGVISEHLTLGVDGVGSVNLGLPVLPRHEDSGIERSDVRPTRRADHAAVVTVQVDAVHVTEIVSELALPGAHDHSSEGLLPPVLHGALVAKVGIAVLLGEDSTLDGNKVSRLSVLGRYRPVTYLINIVYDRFTSEEECPASGTRGSWSSPPRPRQPFGSRYLGKCIRTTLYQISSQIN